MTSRRRRRRRLLLARRRGGGARERAWRRPPWRWRARAEGTVLHPDPTRPGAWGGCTRLHLGGAEAEECGVLYTSLMITEVLLACAVIAF